MSEIKKEIKNAVENYQCPGCTSGSTIGCYKKGAYENQVECARHSAGTFMPMIGGIYLGMPTGFNRAGVVDNMKMQIFEKFEDGWGFNKFNVPVWKHLNKEGHTLVRGICPRTNSPFLHIFLENCMDKISCQEITEQDISEMD